MTRRSAAARINWRAFVEQERTAAVKTNFAVNGADFPANLVADRATYLGLGGRIDHVYGLDPRGLALVDRSAFRGSEGRFALRSRGARPDRVAWARSSRRIADGCGGSSIGGLPAQRRWYLGGSQTVRGQSPDTTQSGNAFWLTRAELGSNDAGLRPTVFADLGWVGDRSKMGDIVRPMSGVGAGVSFLDGLFRFDVARGIYPRKQFRVDLYLEAKF